MSMKEKISTYTCPDNIDEWVDRELERCHRADEADVEGALSDVLYYCREYQRPLPEWASLKLSSVLKSSLCGNGEKKTGRHAKWIKEYKQDMTDYTRADCVNECREHGIKWSYAYIVASELLEGTFADGSADTIKKSYQRYKRRSAENPYRYIMLLTIRTPDINQRLTPERLNLLNSLHNEELRGRRRVRRK